MIIKRNLYSQLEHWKFKTSRKPLIISGARQVGKSTLIKKFSEVYDQKIILNLEKSADLSFFKQMDNVKNIVESLFLANNIARNRKSTLLFIDEIQESPETIQLLRYFYEDFPDIHVIAAGSLLEFAFKDISSFPVGRVEYLYLHPLNFIEFLGALNHDQALKQITQIPVQSFAHQTLLRLYNIFAIVGGMPEVVDEYRKSNSLVNLQGIYESIWSTYQDDGEKYAKNDTERKVIRHIMSTAHFMIDQRIKFQNFGNSNYRSREVGEAFRSLDAARIIQLIYPTTAISPPIQPDLRKSPKLQFLDTGIVNYTLAIQQNMIGLNDLSSLYKGAIIPHLVTQEIIALNYINKQKPHFWIREKNQASSEVDLVINYKDLIIPIEIKSGSTGSLRSLHQFIWRSSHHYAVRVYGGEFLIEKTKTPEGKPYILMNLPYYLSSKIPEYLAYLVENY